MSRQLAKAELEFKRALVSARKDAGLSQEQVAAVLGVSDRTIAEFERVDSDPSLSMVRHYAHAIGALVTFNVAPKWAADVVASWTPVRGEIQANFDIQALNDVYIEHNFGIVGLARAAVAFTSFDDWVGDVPRTGTLGGVVKEIRLQELTRWDGG